MMSRKKKLISFQIILLISSILIIFFTYVNRGSDNESNSILKSEAIINSATKKEQDNTNIFYDIEYKGLDLSGNRYVLKSKKARIEKDKKENVYMEMVEGNFFFKDDTVLRVWSKKGVYNNSSLDMIFEDDVKADYNNSKLSAKRAEYLNSKGFLIISQNVKLNDERGNIFADKLIFDIKDKNLKIQSDDNDLINANVKLK